MLLNNPRLNINGGDIQSAAAEIEKLELERQKRSEVSSDKLVQSIQDLTKTLVNVERNAARSRTTGGGVPTIRGMIQDRVTNIKNLTTGSGFFGKLASSSSNPIIGSIFGTLAERQARKEEERQKTKDFVSSVATGTTYGRQLTGAVGNKRAAEMLKEDYKKQQALETKIYAREEKRRAMIETGRKSGIETDLDQSELDELEQYKKELQEAKEKYKRQSIPLADVQSGGAEQQNRPNPDISRTQPDVQTIDQLEQNGQQNVGDSAVQTAAAGSGRLIRNNVGQSGVGGVQNRLDSSTLQADMQDAAFRTLKMDLLESIKLGMQQEIKTLPPEELQILQAQGPDFMSGVGSQIFEEIQALSKEQLVQLIKISDALEVDKEAALESKQRSLLGPLAGADGPAAAPQASMLEKLLGGLGGKFAETLGGLFDFKKIGAVLGVVGAGMAKIGVLLKGLLPFVGPALAVAAAGAAGAGVGSLINDTVEKHTGDSVGGHTYTGVQKFKQFIGMETDEDKAKKAEKQSVIDLIERKKKAGEPISSYLVGEAKKYGIDITGVKIQEQNSSNASNNASNVSSNLTNNAVKIQEQNTSNASNNTSNASNNASNASNNASNVSSNLTNNANNLQNVIETTANINKQVSKDLTKISTANMLEQATDQSTMQKTTNTTAQNPVIVNAPQTVNNRTMQIVRPPLRNADPTWLDTSHKRLAY